MRELTLDFPPHTTGPDIATWRHCERCHGWMPARNSDMPVTEGDVLRWVWNADCGHYILDTYVRNVHERRQQARGCVDSIGA